MVEMSIRVGMETGRICTSTYSSSYPIEKVKDFSY